MGKGGVGNHPHLTEEELKEFQELFDLVDLDHGGSISPEELGMHTPRHTYTHVPALMWS